MSRRSRVPGPIDAGALPAPDGFTNTKCCDFDGVDEWVSIGHLTAFDFERTDAFSFSLWIKTTASAMSYSLIAKQGWNYTAVPGYFVRMRSSGKPEVFYVNGASNQINVKTTTLGGLNDGSWHHLAVTYDGSSNASGIAFYIDGVAAATTIVADTLSGTIKNTKAFSIGALAGEDFWFLGKLDDVSVWNCALSQMDVNNIYNAGVPKKLTSHPKSNNLVGWWRMGDGDTFPTLLDNADTNDGTMTNMEAGDITTDAP